MQLLGCISDKVLFKIQKSRDDCHMGFRLCSFFGAFLTAPRFYVRTCSERRLRSYIIFSKSIVPINFAAEAFICYRISRVIFMNRAYGNNIIGSEYRYLQFRRKILLLFDCFFCDGFIQNCRLLSNFYR